MTKSDYKKEMLSLIVTVFNETETIESFLSSYLKQTVKPGELVIVDANSSDNTVDLIKDFAQNNSLVIRLFIKKGNRSVGRNLAVKKSRGQWLAITDAGCLLDKNCLKELCLKQEESQAPVVAGYHQGLANSAFQEATIPYFLVMPERIKEAEFLPATRSMLIEKSLWQEMGGLDEAFSYNEDYQFANRLKDKGVKIAFSKKAIVYWLPAKNIWQFCQKIYYFAKGDATAGLIRKKVYLIFLRYLIFLGILLFFPNIYLIFSLMGIYLLWAILKNLRYCPRSYFYLPILQLSADWMVMSGTSVGFFQSNFFNKS
ncbi:MAG: glycosyltransferase [Candidatus Pacebacteria bacterium]|jgi:glycosyltransferase involved in cell wall biosynthesis|nr:glycosyltransferase [Candidatus Paceibacterota bacterium]